MSGADNEIRLVNGLIVHVVKMKVREINYKIAS